MPAKLIKRETVSAHETVSQTAPAIQGNIESRARRKPLEQSRDRRFVPDESRTR